MFHWRNSVSPVETASKGAAFSRWRNGVSPIDTERKDQCVCRKNEDEKSSVPLVGTELFIFTAARSAVDFSGLLLKGEKRNDQ